MPVIELGHLSPAQKRAYVIADNRLALDAGWDDEQVARWLINRLFFGISKQSVISSLAGTFARSFVICSLSEVDIRF